MEGFAYPENAPGKPVYREILRVLRSREVPEDFFCEFFENLSLWESAQDGSYTVAEEDSVYTRILEYVPFCTETEVSDTPSHSEGVVEKQPDKEKQYPKMQNIKKIPDAKTLADTLMYISATLEVYSSEGMTEKLTKACENIKKNVKLEEEDKYEIEDEMLSLLKFFNFHKNRKCLYFIMMGIGARKVGSYFKEYVQLQTCGFTEEGEKEEEGILDTKCKMCLFHVMGIEPYCHTMTMQLQPGYIYLTRLNKYYEEAMRDVISRKRVSILYSISSKTQRLSMLAITTMKTTYIFNLLAARIKYIPVEIKKMLEKPTIEKFIGGAMDLFECIYVKHNVQISNFYDVQELDLEARRQLNPEQLECRKLSLSELFEKGAERLDNVKFKMEPNLLKKWHSKPVSKEVINATATACMYMHKISSCLKLTDLFLSHELKENVAKIMELMADEP